MTRWCSQILIHVDCSIINDYPFGLRLVRVLLFPSCFHSRLWYIVVVPFLCAQFEGCENPLNGGFLITHSWLSALHLLPLVLYSIPVTPLLSFMFLIQKPHVVPAQQGLVLLAHWFLTTSNRWRFSHVVWLPTEGVALLPMERLLVLSGSTQMCMIPSHSGYVSFALEVVAHSTSSLYFYPCDYLYMYLIYLSMCTDCHIHFVYLGTW